MESKTKEVRLLTIVSSYAINQGAIVGTRAGRKILIVLALLLFFHPTQYAQNIGVNTTTPRFPLSFNVSNGDKLSLFDDGNPANFHFGMGIGSGQLFQIFSATVFDDIAFGSGNSSNFTERMRIKGNGNIGIGTFTPGTRLQVSGTTTTTNLILNGSGNGNIHDFLIKSDVNGLVGSRKGHAALAMTYLICTGGAFVGPSTADNFEISWIGEIKLFAGDFVSPGWMRCEGQILNIGTNQALFAILGVQYGGNAQTTFALPDLRGAAPVGYGTPTAGNSWVHGERSQ